MASEKSVNDIHILRMIPGLGLRFRIVIPFLVLLVVAMIMLASAFRLADQALFELLLISIISLLLTVGLGLTVAGQLSRRIGRIIRAAEQVSRGNLAVRIEDERDDEVGRLGRAFNQMMNNLSQLQFGQDLLSRTMSPAVRQVLMERGLDFRGISQMISVMFIDIRDFTHISEGHITEQIVFFLNDYYVTIANQVHSGGGIIGKYGGDSILAYFGAPKPQSPSESSTAALLTALALQDAIEQMNQRWGILGLPAIQVGIGISIGPVVAGPIGSEEQFEYTVIGNAVNLASRLQDLTRTVPNYNIIISSDVYEALETRIKTQIQVVSREAYENLAETEKARRPTQFIDLGEVMVRGKRGLVHVYGIHA